MCYKHLTGKDVPFSKIAIEYEKGGLTVSVYDHEVQGFVHCFSQDVTLDYEGFFVISASSGDLMGNSAQHTYMNSFKLFDPTAYKISRHFEEMEERKAEHVKLSSLYSEMVSDLIHDGAVEMGEFDLTEEELTETLAVQMYYLQSKTFIEAEHMLGIMSGHFQEIASVMNENELYDHTIKLN